MCSTVNFSRVNSDCILFFKDVSLAEVLRTNPVLIDQLALLLDREKRLIANWKHLCRVLEVDPKVVSSLEHYTDFSPTIRLFEHLEVVKPDLSIQHLKQALSDIGRNDLVSLLTCKGKVYMFTAVQQSRIL